MNAGFRAPRLLYRQNSQFSFVHKAYVAIQNVNPARTKFYANTSGTNLIDIAIDVAICMADNSIRCAAYLDKGGTGKTTSVAHFGVALAEDGYDTLLIDLAGKQGDLAKQFGVADQTDPDDWLNIRTVFQPQWEQVATKLGDAAVDELIIETDEGVDLIPAHEGLDSLDIELESKYDGTDTYSQLDEFLNEHIDETYDVVLLDLPGMANNVTYNGVWTAQHVLTPVEAGEFEADQADALSGDLDDIREKHNHSVDHTMLLPNKIDFQTNLSDRYLERYQNDYPDEVAPEPVPFSQDIRNATSDGKTAFALEEPSKTAKAAREAYRANARELITRIQN